jgi:TPR repeat protein
MTGGKRLLRLLGATFALSLGMLLGGTGTPAQAARHALLVGIGDYDQKNNGMATLSAPAYDAEALGRVLGRTAFGFQVDVLVDQAAKDKATFEAALQKFLARVKPGDEVLFYFSGHGINLGDKGNYFVLLDAKDQDAYIREQRRKPGSARELDSQDKENKRYEQYLTEAALSEVEIERAIKNAGADVVIIVADACRVQLSGSKGLVPVNGLRLPADPPKGSFRFYASRRGQVSYDSPEKLEQKKPDRSAQAPKKEDKKERKTVNSLFTDVLLAQLTVPRQEINVLFSKVKLDVRDLAKSLYGKEQVPDYDDSLTSRFYFWKGEDVRDLEALCSTADVELDRLRRGVAAGSVFAEDIERTRNVLAPCSSDTKNYIAEINGILRLHEQGGGGSLSGQSRDQVLSVDPNDPLQQCDALAASPLDQNRPQGFLGVDLQAVAIDGRASEERRLPAVDRISRAIQACAAAVKERGRVARYKFNLAGAHYAMATLADGLANKTESLVQASRHFQDAVDLGYAAAYNGLALMLEHGEYHDPVAGKQMPRNRQKARELFQRGADLGHVLALYHLGLAYKNGGLGLDDELTAETVALPQRGAGKAFQYLSKAAESGFVPAMIETALALRGAWGNIPQNAKRAIELLELAAARGSWEAMYQLGKCYDEVAAVQDANDAIIWYARAAEAGDRRSQERLAEMLNSGEGLPAAQREAAGRYWRLAAEGGSTEAQMQLANLLRDGKLPFRPKQHGRPDGGAEEIRLLYESAFARGKSHAGYELARLYRAGFPKDRTSEAIPKDAETAVNLLWETMDRVRQARLDTAEAYPMVEVFSAFELLNMHEAGEDKRNDRSQLLNEDQVAQLATDYGDHATLKWLNFRTAVLLANVDADVFCNRDAFSRNLAFWSWKRSIPPTDPQFDWFERFYRCHEVDRSKKAGAPAKQASGPEFSGLKRVREFYRKQYEAWLKEAEAVERGKGKGKDKVQSFTDKISQLLVDGDNRRKRQ